MKYLVNFIWWVTATIVMFVDILIWVSINFFIMLWNLDFDHQMNWRKYKVRERNKSYKIYYTRKDILTTYKEYLLFEDYEVRCDKDGYLCDSNNNLI